MTTKIDERMEATFGLLRAALDAAEKFERSMREAQEAKVGLESMRPNGSWDVHWITTADGDLEDVYSCSECEGEVLRRSKYCPNCGAKME